MVAQGPEQMFSRVVSLILIAAIIACPLCCGNGFCLFGQSAAQQLDSPHPASDHCCSASRSQPTGPSDEQRPSRCPPHSSCQGVCGGAVFEKTIDLDQTLASLGQPLPGTEARLDARLIDANAMDSANAIDSTDRQWQYWGSSNFGRSLRTLYLSYLC